MTTDRTLDDYVPSDEQFPDPIPEVTGKAEAAAEYADLVSNLIFGVAYRAMHAITVYRAEQYPLYRYYLERDKDGAKPLDADQFKDYIENARAIRQIEHAMSPAPDVEQFLKRASTANPGTRVLSTLRWAHQRLTRGWDDRALWSLDVHTTQTLGHQLLALADVANGYPGTDEYPDYDQWVADLRANGEALLAYSEAADFVGTDRAEAEQVTERAREAMHWVAHNLYHLYD